MSIFIRFPVKFPDTPGWIQSGFILIENLAGQRGRITPSATATISLAVVAQTYHPWRTTPNKSKSENLYPE